MIPPLRQLLNSGPQQDDAELERLSKMSRIDYDRARKGAAKGLGVSVSTLDLEVFERRGSNQELSSLGNPYEPKQIVPWHQSVSGNDLLRELVSTIEKHVIFPEHASIVAALWVLHTHCYELWDQSPRLALLSPTKRSGKTTALCVLEQLVARPARADNITPAAIFRIASKFRPTLLIDEVDSFMRQFPDMRNVINSSHARGGSTIRCVGDDHRVFEFKTYTPIALSGIGSLPETIADRSIIISMERKLSSQPIQKYRSRANDVHFSILASKAARFVDDNSVLLCEEIDPPAALNDRAADNWRPLLSIARACGAEWLALAARAAIHLSNAMDVDIDDPTLLVGDCVGVFKQGSEARMSSSELCNNLNRLEDRKWAHLRDGKGLDPVLLSRALKPFNVRSKTVRLDDGTQSKGYEYQDFVRPFEHYCASTPIHEEQSRTTVPTNEAAQRRTNSNVKTVTPLEVETFSLFDERPNSIDAGDQPLTQVDKNRRNGTAGRQSKES